MHLASLVGKVDPLGQQSSPKHSHSLQTQLYKKGKYYSFKADFVLVAHLGCLNC